MKDRKTHIAALQKEAQEATDSDTNGLMVQEDFLEMIRRLLVVTRELSTECEQLERQRDALRRRLANSLHEVAATTVPLNRHDQLQLTSRDMGRQEGNSEGIREVVARLAGTSSDIVIFME